MTPSDRSTSAPGWSRPAEPAVPDACDSRARVVPVLTPSGRPTPELAGFDPETARRVLLTVSCPDSDGFAKVSGAGGIEVRDGTRVQVMHNGVVVEEGGYFGPWMDEIIRCLGGHHEPQEELVFGKVLERLAAEAPFAPAVIELGSFWAYYSLWFLEQFPHGRVLAMEPDPDNLELGRRNFALNGRSGDFVHGVIGADPGATMTFISELRGTPHEVVQHDLASLMAAGQLDRVDLLMCDIQGGETPFFEQAAALLRAGAVRFAVVSTHHHSISGHPLTHQLLLARLQELGGHVIAEHTVGESFSGDGLIVVSFDERDRDFSVPTSHARQGDSLFGALEYDLARSAQELATCRAHAQHLASTQQARQAELTEALAAVHLVQQQLEAVHSTRLWRYAERPRRMYHALLQARSHPS